MNFNWRRWRLTQPKVEWGAAPRVSSMTTGTSASLQEMLAPGAYVGRRYVTGTFREHRRHYEVRWFGLAGYGYAATVLPGWLGVAEAAIALYRRPLAALGAHLARKWREALLIAGKPIPQKPCCAISWCCAMPSEDERQLAFITGPATPLYCAGHKVNPAYRPGKKDRWPKGKPTKRTRIRLFPPAGAISQNCDISGVTH